MRSRGCLRPPRRAPACCTAPWRSAIVAYHRRAAADGGLSWQLAESSDVPIIDRVEFIVAASDPGHREALQAVLLASGHENGAEIASAEQLQQLLRGREASGGITADIVVVVPDEVNERAQFLSPARRRGARIDLAAAYRAAFARAHRWAARATASGPGRCSADSA